MNDVRKDIDTLPCSDYLAEGKQTTTKMYLMRLNQLHRQERHDVDASDEF